MRRSGSMLAPTHRPVARQANQIPASRRFPNPRHFARNEHTGACAQHQPVRPPPSNFHATAWNCFVQRPHPACFPGTAFSSFASSRIPLVRPRHSCKQRNSWPQCQLERFCANSFARLILPRGLSELFCQRLAVLIGQARFQHLTGCPSRSPAETV